MSGTVFHPLGCLARGVSTLELIGCWVGPGVGAKIQSEMFTSPVRVHIPGWILPDMSACQLLWPQEEPHHSLLPLGDPPAAAGKSVPRSYKVTAFAPQSFCAPSMSGVSVSPPPQSWGAPAVKPHWLSKPKKSSGDSSLQCQVPRLGSLGGSELSLGELCDIIILQFVVTTGDVELDHSYDRECALCHLTVVSSLCLWM